MNCCGIILLCGVLAGASPVATAPSPAARQEIDKLQGTWRAVKLTVDGRAVDPNQAFKKHGGVRLEVRGDRYEFKGMGIDFKGQLHVDTSSRPKRVEFVRAGGSTSVSTYQFDGDSLQLVGKTDDAEAGKEKSGEAWVFKRERP